MELREYQQGDIIFREGSYGTEFYEIRAGQVSICTMYQLPQETLLVTLGENRYFGEMGVIEEQLRSATAVAATDCTLVVITADSLVDYIREYPEKAKDILSSMSRRTRELSRDYMSACRTISTLRATVNEKRKPSWLKDAVNKFAKLYEESAAAMASDQLLGPVHTYGGSGWTMYY